ncbi:MAG: asparagine synthetase B, partial [Proteobacteria bacterium]|nr:asparagine synthetase B [Pseudomonadota bacterium]
MSGIAGIINFDGEPIAPELLESMTAVMEYRGRDGIQLWLQEAPKGVALGHCLLRTTAESMEEQQPVVSIDGLLVLVMDGRVDNWMELRRQLVSMGAILRDRSDPELILAAYRCWGEGCLDRIDGDFAFAIWHTESRHLFCARDPLGGKPFHYYFSGRQLVFASDVHAVLGVPGVPEEPNPGVIAECL